MQIVVGVDGSAGAQQALAWALAEAAARACPLRAVLAYGFYGRPREVDDLVPAADADGLRKAASSVLAGAVERLPAQGRAALRAELTTEVSADEPVDALLERVSADDILVVGARGLGPVRRLLLGSVGVHCVRHAHTPVVVVRRSFDGGTSRAHPVVAGVDGSDESIHALSWAAEHARVRGLPLLVVRAWSLLPGPAPQLTDVLSASGQRDRDVAEFEAILDRVIPAKQGAHVTLRVVDGQAAPVLLEAAADAELLVVGSRGMGGFNRLLLGSTSSACLVHSRSDVAVIPGPQRG